MRSLNFYEQCINVFQICLFINNIDDKEGKIPDNFMSHFHLLRSSKKDNFVKILFLFEFQFKFKLQQNLSFIFLFCF